MDELFLKLQELIAESMSELTLIDEDYGQLTLSESQDTYPVTFPCVLIGNIEGEWSNITAQPNGPQKGKCNVTVKLAIDCYDDTHYSSGTAWKIKERIGMNINLFKTLHGVSIGGTPLKRVKSIDYSLPRAIKVYETVFYFEFTDNSGSK